MTQKNEIQRKLRKIKECQLIMHLKESELNELKT